MLNCSLLTPLGEHRRTHIHPSKGKKRKRKSKDESTTEDTPPPAPEIGKHVLIGINSVTRHLEALAAQHAPSTTPVAISRTEEQETAPGMDNPRPLSMVITTHPKPSSSTAHAHLPTLVHLSTVKSSSLSSQQATRLIPLATATDPRLASLLHIPRVGALAIFADAPGAQALEAYVREKVGVTECPWIDEAMTAEWRGLNIKNETAIGKTKAKPKAEKKEQT
jgi:ribonuclease P/MRP protein subunit POP3